MPLPVSSIPTSVVVTNNTTQELLLGYGLRVKASEENKAIDLSKLSADVKVGPGFALAGASPREMTWQAIVELSRTNVLTIESTVPDILPLTAAAYVKGGDKAVDTFVHDGLANR